MFVTKADGSLENFDGKKIIGTCTRAGLDESQSAEVLNSVTKQAYDKIPTNALLKIILKEIRKFDRAVSMKYNLRAALSALSPEGIFFEKYVKKLLESRGYSVEWNRIARGRCAAHQIDLIATNGKDKIMVECKHHMNYHTFTGLGDALETWAKFEDTAKNNDFTGAWLVCNTKASEHAVSYASCKGVKLMCWNYSLGVPNLNAVIEEAGLYPITILASVPKRLLQRSFESDILTVKDIVAATPQALRKVFGADSGKIQAEAKSVLGHNLS